MERIAGEREGEEGLDGLKTPEDLCSIFALSLIPSIFLAFRVDLGPSQKIDTAYPIHLIDLKNIRFLHWPEGRT